MLRQWIYQHLEYNTVDDKQASVANNFLILLIFINIAAATLETIPQLFDEYADIFLAVELVSIVIFTIEYILRVWICLENSKFESRWSYLVSAPAIIDFISVFPFYLSLVLQLDLQIFIIFRLLRLLKMVRYFEPLSILGTALKAEFSSFISALFILFILVMVASTGMYLLEKDIQPDVFGNIPQAMWWAVVTLTTMGYGDVIPVTATGKVFASVITILSIGTVALPAGMLASRFSEELKSRKENFAAQVHRKQHNGYLCEQSKAELEHLRIAMSLSRQEAKTLVDNVCVKGKGECPHCGQLIKKNQE